MGRRISLAAVVATAALCAGLIASPATAPAYVPNINWVELLPPLPSPNAPQPHSVPHCKHGTKSCIDTEIRRMRRLRNKLGCDHRAVFTETYLKLTRVLRRTNNQQPHLIRYHRYLYFEDALFADMYFDTFHAYQQGADVPEAWRIAFQTDASGNAIGPQDMLLGINAHVQNDMPYVIAALGLRTRSGATRKHDHDAVNLILNHAYTEVVHEIRDRYDPLIGLTNSDLTPLDDIAGLEAVRAWREVVWRNAERLVNAKTEAERRQVSQSIESYAGLWANLIAHLNLNLPPDYRATRDAYCQKQLAG
jgi:hypothetical protein